ncbi:hypothetical protein [Nitratireductor indicus]|nr:hypothetical protein [Nitratireductor indicus]
MTPPQPMAGEAVAHVQGFGLKAMAVVSGRLTNSPVTRRMKRWWPFSGDKLGEPTMEDASFLQNLIEAYSNSSVGVQILWALSPTTTLFLLIIAMGVWTRMREQEPDIERGELIYSIHCRADSTLRVERHGHYRPHEPALLMVAPPMQGWQVPLYGMD